MSHLKEQLEAESKFAMRIHQESQQTETEQIIENNKIIAEFMGGEFKPVPRYSKVGGNTNYSEWRDCKIEMVNGISNSAFLKFHSSWDWLKPVIDKIAVYSLAYPQQVDKVRNMKIIVDIKPAYDEVVNFIKWYQNENI